jgi:hypothetical protein
LRSPDCPDRRPRCFPAYRSFVGSGVLQPQRCSWLQIPASPALQQGEDHRAMLMLVRLTRTWSAPAKI